LHGASHRVSLGSELAKINSEALNLAMVTDEFDDEYLMRMLILRHTLKKKKQESARAMKKTCNLQWTQLPMHRLAQLTKTMSQMT
jgi:hypothetical protein